MAQMTDNLMKGMAGLSVPQSVAMATLTVRQTMRMGVSRWFTGDFRT